MGVPTRGGCLAEMPSLQFIQNVNSTQANENIWIVSEKQGRTEAVI